MTLFTVPGTGFAQLLINAGDGPTMVINRDETTQLFVGDDNSVASKQGTGDIDIIDPLSYIVYDGIKSKYGICAVGSGPGIQVNTVKGATNWQPSPQQAALQISLLGLATAANQQTTQNTLTTGIALPANAAKETGGNLATHTSLLSGTTTGALISGAGRTVAQETAALIASGSAAGNPGGTPLLHGYNVLRAPGTQTNLVAAGTSNQGPYTISKPGYLIQVSASIAAAGTTIPILEVALVWSDSASGQVTAVETWYVPANPTASISTYGKGPTKGNQLTIHLVNWDPTNPMSTFVGLEETTQHISRDDWRNGVLSNVPTFVAPPISDPFAGILGAGNGTAIGANGTLKYLLPVYAGQAQLNVLLGVGQNFTITLTPIDPGVTNMPPTFFNLNGNSIQGPFNLNLPRTPCLLQFANDVAVADTVTWGLVILEFAS